MLVRAEGGALTAEFSPYHFSDAYAGALTGFVKVQYVKNI